MNNFSGAEIIPASHPASEKTLYAYLDSTRGYACLLVISCHLAYVFPKLPYPFHRVVVNGWYGVQLFFIASCVTLLMSWNHDQRHNRVSAPAFFLRRFFRIAPMYYLAAIFYLLAFPPRAGFDAWQFLATLTFINDWHPALTSTIKNGWSVVPGGWSVSAEFSFYLVFPIFATFVTSFRRAGAATGAAIVAGAILCRIWWLHLRPLYHAEAVTNFIYFSVPNQACVFSLGALAYFAIVWLGRPAGDGTRALLARHGNALTLGALLAFIGLGFVRLPEYLDPAMRAPPGFLVAAVVFAGFVVVLSASPRCLFVNRWSGAIGRVSFSAYLIHFAVLRLPELVPAWSGTGTSGIRAVLAYGATWVVVVGLTYAASYSTYRLVERPMMRAGKKLIDRLPRPAVRPAVANAGLS